MVAYTLLGIAAALIITATLKLYNVFPGGSFLVVLAVTAFISGLVADRGQGMWAGFIASLFFPLLWLPQLLNSPNFAGWLYLGIFFATTGFLTGVAGAFIAIVGNVAKRRLAPSMS